MPSHRLILEDAPKSGEWLLEWDQTTLSVKAPDGQLVFEIPVTRSHWIIHRGKLDTYAMVSFATDAGSLTLRKNKRAARDVRELVLEGLRSDHAFRKVQKQRAKNSIPSGIAAFIICGGLFALYCWWAIRSGDPPRNSFAYKVLIYTGWLIHLVLLLLLAFAAAGLWITFDSLRQLRRIRKMKRALGERPCA